MLRKFLFLFVFSVIPLMASPFSLQLLPHFYADNTEFFDAYRVGETYLGNDLLTMGKYKISDNLDLGLGFYANFYYGDENSISQFLPASVLLYHIGTNFNFIMGALDNKNRHNMLDALQSEELIYHRKMEYGFQLKQNYKYFISDSWINWNLLNTAQHREYFDFGNNFFLLYKIFSLNLQTYISHHGGQLYRTGAVRDNLSMALGLKIDTKWNDFLFNGAGGSVYYLTDKSVLDRCLPNLTTTGKGYLAEIYFYFYNFKLYCDYWKGEKFITEEGNALYKTSQPYIFYGFIKEKYIKENTWFDIELRMHDIDNKFEYQYRLGFTSRFIFKL